MPVTGSGDRLQPVSRIPSRPRTAAASAGSTLPPETRRPRSGPSTRLQLSAGTAARRQRSRGSTRSFASNASRRFASSTSASLTADLVDERGHDRERQLADGLRPHAVADRPRHIRGGPVTIRPSRNDACASAASSGSTPTIRAPGQSASGCRDARDQAAAADAHDNGFDAGERLCDLEPAVPCPAMMRASSKVARTEGASAAISAAMPLRSSSSSGCGRSPRPSRRCAPPSPGRHSRASRSSPAAGGARRPLRRPVRGCRSSRRRRRARSARRRRGELQLKAPRNLNEPVRCRLSGFTNTSPSSGRRSNGVRTATPSRRPAGSLMSASETGSCGRSRGDRRTPAPAPGYPPARGRGTDPGRAPHRLGLQAETAARLVLALEAQFPEQRFAEVRHPRVESVDDLQLAVATARAVRP